MAKKPISQKRAEKEELENRALHRVFNVFLLGLAAECYLFLVYRGYAAGTIDSMLVWHQILTWGMYAGLVMLVAGAAVAFAKRQDARLRTGMLWLGGIGLFLALSGWVVTFFFDNNRGITTMCILVPILVVLALMFTVWLRGASAGSSRMGAAVIVGAVLGAVLLAAAAALTRKAQGDEGKLKGFQVFSLECDYRIIYAALGAAFVCVVLTLALPSIAYYLLWMLGILLFGELVYYTTKLM